MNSAITFTATGAEIVGIPPLDQWAASLDQALMLGTTAAWNRTDLIGFAEDEHPYGDDFVQFLSASRISTGTLRNDARRFRRFPPGHDLRRFAPNLSLSHFDSVAPLSDTDAEVLLAQCIEIPNIQEGHGRDWLREQVKIILNTPDPLKAPLTLIARLLPTGERVFIPTVEPPTWIKDGDSFDVTLKEAA